MSDYIEREAALKSVNRHYPDPNAMCAALVTIPAADVRHMAKSKWADNQVSFYRGCPECGAFVRANLDEVFLRDFHSAVGRLNYCPNCGADMREES